jgi:hypothetical protein
VLKNANTSLASFKINPSVYTTESLIIYRFILRTYECASEVGTSSVTVTEFLTFEIDSARVYCLHYLRAQRLPVSGVRHSDGLCARSVIPVLTIAVPLAGRCRSAAKTLTDHATRKRMTFAYSGLTNIMDLAGSSLPAVPKPHTFQQVQILTSSSSANKPF